MTRFYPDKYLDEVMPGGIAKNGLLYGNLSIKQRYAKALYKAAGKEGKALKETIAKTVSFYAQKEGALNDQALLTQRIENFLVWNKVQEEKASHKGQPYRWLPSDAQNPDPDHQLNYGKIFYEGDGHEMPGERYGCRCGIEWLDVETAFKEFAGNQYTGYKGQDAIKHLMKTKEGFIQKAFYRKEIGYIDLFWGNNERGLAHILYRRTQQHIDTQNFIKNLSTVIKEGRISVNKKNRFEILYKGKMAVVDTEIMGKKKNYILTAFKTRKK